MAVKRRKKAHKAKAHRSRRHRAYRANPRRRRSRRLKTTGRVRPVVIVSGGKYHRPKKSKYFPSPTRINPRRRRHSRHNPAISKSIKQAFTMRSLSRFFAIGGGLFAGTLFSRLLNTGALPFTTQTVLPASVTSALAKVRPFHGLLHIGLGVLITSKAKNPHIKDVGVGLAALGGFDLFTQILSAVGMKGLPTFSGMNVNGMNFTKGGMPRRVTVLNGAGFGPGSSSTAMADSLADVLP